MNAVVEAFTLLLELGFKSDYEHIAQPLHPAATVLGLA
jgi:hypothetical protein